MGVSGAGRAYSRNAPTIWLSRSDSFSTISTSRFRPSSGGRSLASASTAPEIDARGLRISWAMLAERRPTAARRSAWRMRSSICLIADRSWQTPIRPATPPSPVRRDQNEMPMGMTRPSCRPERELVARRRRVVFVRRLPDLVEVDAGAEDRAPTAGPGRRPTGIP